MSTDVQKTFTPLAACFGLGLLSPFLASFLGRGPLATGVAVIGWMCFLALTVLYPFYSIRHGFIRTRTSTTYKSEDPIRFWVGLATLEALMLLLLLLASLALHSYLNSPI